MKVLAVFAGCTRLPQAAVPGPLLAYNPGAFVDEPLLMQRGKESNVIEFRPVNPEGNKPCASHVTDRKVVLVDKI